MDRQNDATTSTINWPTARLRIQHGLHIIKTTVTEEIEIIDEWIQNTYNEQSNRSRILVGLDAEWKPTFRKGEKSKVAILQLCNQSQKCLIVQIIHMNEIPDSLRSFLNDPKCIFMGVEIGHDVKKLKNEYGLDVREILDLSKAAKTYLPFKLERFGLVELAKIVANFHLHKSRNTCMSNWEKIPLSEKQVKYASLDAYASLLVGERISLYMPRAPSPQIMCVSAFLANETDEK